MFNICYMITAYHKPKQLIRLINVLGKASGYSNIYVHIDKKSIISEDEIIDETSHSLNIFKEYNIYWGGFNQLCSIVSLINKASKVKKYDFYILLSGQDMPVLPFSKISEFLKTNREKLFIDCFPMPSSNWNYKGGMGRVEWYWFMDAAAKFRGVQRLQRLAQKFFEVFNLARPVSRKWKFFGGSDWWMLPGSVAEFCASKFNSDKKLRTCFRYSFIPTEMFFQTVIQSSEYYPSIAENTYRYINWSANNSGHPDLISMEMIKDISDSNSLFARKFDLDSRPEVFEYFERIFSE